MSLSKKVKSGHTLTSMSTIKRIAVSFHKEQWFILIFTFMVFLSGLLKLRYNYIGYIILGILMLSYIAEKFGIVDLLKAKYGKSEQRNEGEVQQGDQS